MQPALSARILVVNDAPDMLELIKISLEQEGYRVFTACDGRAGLKLALTTPLDVVVSDVVMPEMDGVELCAALKSNPKTGDLPILLVSALRTAELDSLIGLKAGADDYLELPFRLATLLVKVARLIERKKAHAALSVSETKFKALTENSSVITFALDRNGIFTSSEGAGLKKLNKQPRAAIGKSIFDLYESYPKVLENARRALSGENFTTTSDLGDGVFFETTYSALRDRDNQVDGTVAVMIDISERVAATKQAAEVIEKLKENAEREALINRISAKIRESLRVETVFRSIVEELGTHLAVDRCFLYLLDEEAGLSRAAAAFTTDDIAADTGNLDVPLTASMQKIDKELRIGPRVYNDVAANPNIWQPYKSILLKRGIKSFMLVPIRVDGELTGVITFATTRALRNWTTNEVELACTVADQASIAIRQAELFARTEAVSRREALINRVSMKVRESLRVEDVLHSVVDELGAHLAVDRCRVFLFDEDQKFLRSIAQSVTDNVLRWPAEMQVPVSLVEHLLPAFHETGLLKIDDAQISDQVKQVYKPLLQPLGVRSILVVAIRVGESVIGFLSLVTVKNLKKWSEAELELTKAIADQAGIAIRQAQLFSQAEAVSQRERLINRLSAQIRSSLRPAEVLRTATHELGKVLDASQVYVNFYDSAQPQLPVEPQHIYIAPNQPQAPAPQSVSYDSQIGRRLIYSRQIMVITDMAEERRKVEPVDSSVMANEHRRSVKSAVFCPILVDDGFRGTLFIEQTDRLRKWTESDLTLIEAVASQLALGIANAELFETTRRAKREWEATFDAMSDGVFLFDNKGALKRVNRAGAILEDATPQSLIGRDCGAVDSCVDSEISCIVQSVVETKQSVTREQFFKDLKRPLLVSSEPIFDENGELSGVVSSVRDLYELRAAEAIARERQSLLTYVLEAVLEPIFAVDTTGKLLWCNNATAQIYGASTDVINRRRFVEMAHPEDRAAAETALAASLKKLPQSYESRFLTVAGETRHAIFNSVPLVFDNQVNGALWFVRDITQQKAALQQALQADKLRALGQLASGVAHDFNNVLAAILGRVGLLQRRGNLSSDLLHDLHIIQTAAQDAAQTVRRIQTFAKQSATPEFSSVEIAALLQDSIELTRPRWKDEARQRGNFYDVRLDGCGGLYAYGNASELREVFVNLIVNALDAMPDGGRLHITGHHAADEISISFADTGDGIAPDLQERIFEPFFSTKGVNGTGMGLSVSYSIIEQHKGRIELISEPPQPGSTFIIRLPVYRSIGHKIVTPPAYFEKRKMNVLIVDDEKFVREALMEMVSELATDISSAENGWQALSVLREQRFDVVFTDLSMPEMDGWDLARAIRENWQTTKIVLVTGYGKGLSVSDEQRGLVHAVIGKPFDFAQLTQTLEKITA